MSIILNLGEAMNIYEKIQQIKEDIAKSNLKKSGKNKFAGYTYYELSDFLPAIVSFCNMKKLFTKVSFNNEKATLEIINSENPEEVILYDSPMRDLTLKGCNEIQALGGIETYSRRYLYMTAFDIVESDMFDGQAPKEQEHSICEVCGNKIKASKSNTSKEIAERTKNKTGKIMCIECANKWVNQQNQEREQFGNKGDLLSG